MASSSRVAARWLAAQGEDIEVTVTLRGSPAIVGRVCRLLHAASMLGSWGASREVLLSVDGDGSDRLKVDGILEEHQVDSKQFEEALDKSTVWILDGKVTGK